MHVTVCVFCHQVTSNSLQPHGLQHERPPCPSPSTRVCPSSCTLTQRCHPTISFSVTLFSFCLQSFPMSGSFSVNWLFTSGNQSIGASTSASVLPMSIQSGLTGLICLLSEGLLESSLAPQFKIINSIALSLLLLRCCPSTNLPWWREDGHKGRHIRCQIMNHGCGSWRGLSKSPQMVASLPQLPCNGGGIGSISRNVLERSSEPKQTASKWKVKSEVTRSCPTLCDPMDCSLPHSSVHGIFQARVLEWITISFLQRILPTQGLNLGLPHCRQTLYHLSHQEKCKRRVKKLA